MDYKKILAAATVASTAIIIPIAAEATDPAPTAADLLSGVSSTTYGATVTAIASINDVAITKYEWFIVTGPNAKTALASTSNELIIPVEATGHSIELVATDANGDRFNAVVAVDIQTMAATFHDLNDDPPTDVTSAEALVNAPISVGFPPPIETTTITKYEWYIYNAATNQYYLLTSERDMLIDIPPLASGKTLRLIITTANDEKFRADLKVKELELADEIPMDILLNNREIPETGDVSLAPNDVLSVENLEIVGKNGELLSKSQANISYQWFFTTADGEPTTSSLITDATNVSFSIPRDAYYRTLQSFKVRIDIDIPDAGVKKSYYSQPITLNIVPAEDLVREINALFESTYKYSQAGGDFDAFEANIAALQKSYNALSINSKVLVTNYDKLQNAQMHVQVVKPILKQLDAFNLEKQAFDAEETELKHAKLLEQFEQIEKQYKKLTGLQRSLFDLTEDFGNNYMEEMFKFLKNIKEIEDNGDTTAETIKKINNDILALYLDSEAFVKEYNLDDGTREEFAAKVQALQARAATVDKVHQSVLYTTALKNAKTDVKKAASVAEKIYKVSITAGTKRVNAALAARQAYNKLSVLQKSLITEEELNTLLETEEAAEIRTDDIIKWIDQLLENGAYNVGSEFTFNDNVYTFAGALEYLTQAYKSLNSSTRQRVANYNLLKQAQKDFKAASKVINNINKAVLLYEAAGNVENAQAALRKANSSYRTAYKSYVKLTPLQRTMLNNNNSLEDDIAAFLDDYASLSDLVNVPEADSPAANKYDEAKVANVVGLLETLETNVTTNVTTLEDVQAKIAEIKAAYRALTAPEKKNVYNYSILATANSIATKASSVQKKLRAAQASNNEAKLTSALAAYRKLSIPQQQLILTAAQEVTVSLGGMQPDYSAINEALVELKNELNVENIVAVTELIQGLSPKELKNLVYYKDYQEALKQKNIVDKFVTNINKLGENPSYSKRQTALLNYKKLTTTQSDLLAVSYTDFYDLLEEWDDELNDDSTDLNDRIGNVLVAEVYQVDEVVGEGLEFTASFLEYIAQLEEEYKALDMKERRLITHKSFFTIAKRDAKAIEPLIRLVESIENVETNVRAGLILQAERTYDRLTTQQQNLFDQSGVEIPEA
ncbi:MAG: hypothetical protein ABS951_11410 [Solibacillus sp.]